MKKIDPLEYRAQFKEMAKYIDKQNKKFYLAGICVYLHGIDKSLEKIAESLRVLEVHVENVGFK